MKFLFTLLLCLPVLAQATPQVITNLEVCIQHSVEMHNLQHQRQNGYTTAEMLKAAHTAVHDHLLQSRAITRSEYNLLQQMTISRIALIFMYEPTDAIETIELAERMACLKELAKK